MDQELSDRNVILLEIEGPVATVSLNRPEDDNAIGDTIRAGLHRAIDEIEAKQAIRVVILRSAVDGVFSVGADLNELGSLTAIEAAAFAEKSRQAYARLTSLDVPVVAAIDGTCIGQGLELALHCDVRFASQDAQLGLPGVNVGTIPGGGSLSRLSMTVGQGPATALALTGGVISAERALMLGLVSNVVAPGDLDEAARELADHLAGLSPVAIREIKRLMVMAAEDGGETVSAKGIEAFTRCFAEGDAAERLNTLTGGPAPGSTVH